MQQIAFYDLTNLHRKLTQVSSRQRENSISKLMRNTKWSAVHRVVVTPFYFDYVNIDNTGTSTLFGQCGRPTKIFHLLFLARKHVASVLFAQFIFCRHLVCFDYHYYYRRAHGRWQYSAATGGTSSKNEWTKNSIVFVCVAANRWMCRLYTIFLSNSFGNKCTKNGVISIVNSLWNHIWWVRPSNISLLRRTAERPTGKSN